MSDRLDLSRIAIVLHEPRFSENVGSAARAMSNMGLSRLIVVNPESFDPNRAASMATHGGLPLLLSMETADSLMEAVGPFGYVVGATARLGGIRKASHSPERMAATLAPLCTENDVAIVFGREDRGLVNDDIKLCHSLVTIPTAGLRALNLAQSVMIICYELFRASIEEKQPQAPRLANRFELEAMYASLSEMLTRIGFLNPDNPEHWMLNLRRFFSRLPLTAREVKILRGICRQMDWYTRVKLGREAPEPVEEPGKE